MRRMFFIGFVLLSLPFSRQSWAMNMTQFVRIPSTLSGPSGLLLTQSIDTLESGRFELGLGLVQNEGSVASGGDLSSTRLSSTFTMGVSHSMEASLQIPYFAKIDGKINAKEINDSSLGDINLSVKWRFLEPSTALNFPGFALSLTGFLASGEREIGAGSVGSWGLKALIVSSAETEIGISGGSILVGFYADGGVYMQDSGKKTEETHGIVDLGLLIPLSFARDIHLLLEGSVRTKRDTPFGKDYTGLMTGLRYVTKHTSWSTGFQRRFNDGAFDDSNIILFQGGYFF